eukprot:225162-Chlamydomonas_euryale.AAC.1
MRGCSWPSLQLPCMSAADCSRPSAAGRRRLRTACLRCCTVRSFAACRTACETPWAGGPKA